MSNNTEPQNTCGPIEPSGTHLILTGLQEDTLRGYLGELVSSKGTPWEDIDTLAEILGMLGPEDGRECKCKNCAEDSDSTTLLENGYCEECFDQGCDQEEDLH